MSTFSLKDYYENLKIQQELGFEGNERKESKAEESMKDEEYSGGIPIPFMGWAHIDDEDRQAMLEKQLEIVNAELLEAKTVVMEQAKILDLYQRFIKEEHLLRKWMFFIADRKSI